VLESRSPSDDRLVLGRFHTADAQAVDQAVVAAKAAQRVWAKTAWETRVAKMRKAADAISKDRLRLAAMMSLEVGKTRIECLGDVEEAADLLRYYATQVEEAQGFNRPLGRLSPNEDTRDLLRPYGVFLVISPFNFPVALAAGMASAALVAGNAVILKPSEEAMWCAQGLYEAFAEAELPAGLFQVLHGTGETVGAALTNHPGIDGVAFTGSTKVGLELQRIMSQGRVRPCLMEMGGKNAAVVTKSADLDDAVEGCARSAFGFSGQKCSALSRLYVAKELHEAFVAKLVERARRITVGDPTRREVEMGPVVNRASIDRFARAIGEVHEGGRVHAGGARLAESALEHGTFVQPTVVSVPRGHRLFRDELFLPFVAVEPFDTFDEALALTNDVPFGLTAGIFSGDTNEVERFLDEAEAGVLYANRKQGATTGAWPGVQSFCGWKGSGSTGKGGCGPYYVAQFTREQSQTRVTK